MRPSQLFFLCATLLTALAVARATSVIPPEFSELSANSDYVIRGKVKSLTNEIRMRDGREVPFTLVQIEVSEVIAGTPPANVVLTMLGGRTSDGSELSVDGVPKFAVGDEDVLFVRSNGINFYPLYAAMHGRFPVKHSKTTGREYIARANGVPLATTAEIALPMAEGKIAKLLRQQRSADDALTPAEFVQSIREARALNDQGGVVHEK